MTKPDSKKKLSTANAVDVHAQCDKIIKSKGQYRPQSRKQGNEKMAKTIKKGKDVAGNVVEVTAARFVPSNAKNLQSTLKICLDRSAKTE